MLRINIKDLKSFISIGEKLAQDLLKVLDEIKRTSQITIYPKNSPPQNIPFNVDAKNYLVAKYGSIYKMRELILAHPSKHKQIINDVDTYIKTHKPLGLNVNEFKTHLQHFFISNGFDKLDKHALIDAIGLRTCPYCNRGYIYRISRGQINPVLDHFYPKSIYPILGASLYNLIPCCHTCNGFGAKGKKDVMKSNPNYQIYSPYLIKHDTLRFNYKLKSPEYYTGKGVEVLIEDTDSSTANAYEHVFKLKSLYKHHADIVGEILYRKKYLYTDSMLESLEKIVGRTLSTRDIEIFIVGNYITEENYHKRPLAKLSAEIIKR